MLGHFDDASSNGGNSFGYAGSRTGAIASGLLMDVSDVAHDTGFKWSVAFTRCASNEWVNPRHFWRFVSDIVQLNAWIYTNDLRHTFHWKFS